MEYKEIQCRCCGSPMRIRPGATRIQCEYCGTEYVLRGQEKEIRTIDYQGRGALFQTYIPAGWNYRVRTDSSASPLNTVGYDLILESPGGAQLVYYPFAYYRNYMPGGSMGRKDYQCDGGSMSCWRHLSEPVEYARERICATVGQIEELRLEPVENQKLEARLPRFQQESEARLKRQVAVGAYRFRFRFSRGGQIYDGYFAMSLCWTADALKAQKQAGNSFLDMLKSGGLAGLGFLGGIGLGTGAAIAQNPGQTSDWGRDYDMLLMWPREEGRDLSDIFDRFMEELRLGPAYYALQEEEFQNVLQIMANGYMQRQQNAIRSSQQISRTLSETSDIVMAGYEERSRSMDEIYRKNSEAVRGVNSYTDSAGRAYEADVAYDHVYRKGDTFVGSKNGSWEAGPEWEELKRR